MDFYARVKTTTDSVTCSSRLSLHDGSPFSDPSLYRSIAGSLQYLSLTRPVIAYAINQACQFMHQPSSSHWLVVKRILRYLKGIINHGLHISPSSFSTLHGFSDADWGGNPDDRRSVSGFIIFLGSNPISLSLKKQRTVARSSTESEYKSLVNATAELVWLQSLLGGNLSVIYLTANPMFHARTKHIEIDYHFVRERFMWKELSIHFISSDDQLADGLTKGLPTNRFSSIRPKLNVVSPLLNLRGVTEGSMAITEDNRESFS